MSKNVGSGPIRWLHLSDLHFRADEKWDRRATLAALIRKVKELKEEGRGPDLVFLTGDIAFSGKKAEYDQAFIFLDQLQAATGLDPSKRFFLIPGNHDVDRSQVKKAEDRTLKAESQGEIEELLGDHEMMKRLGRRLEAFYAFTERIQGPARGWVPERPWRVDFPDAETGLGSVAVLQLNSAWASGSNDEKHLLVGEMQVREALLEAESATLKIVLVHHPISELTDFDRARLETLLPAEKVQFLLFGHLHRQRPRVQITPSGHIVELATGATHNEDEYPRGFAWGEFDPSGKLEVSLFAYSPEGRGFWVLDNRASEQAPTGVWTVDLAMPQAVAPKKPSAERTATIATRYRQAVQQVHGIARFVGFADNRPRPNARVEELFIPLRLESVETHEAWTTTRLLSLLVQQRESGRPRAVLLGDPGSGKTTLSRFAAVWLAGGIRVSGATPPEDSVLPLFLPFREYIQACEKNECSLLGFLEEQASSHLQVKLPDGFLQAAIERGDSVLLLDGMDEVGDSGIREAIRERILAFCELYPRLPVLITSRIAGYNEAPLPAMGRGGFLHFRLAPFNDKDLAQFVRNWYAVQEPVDPSARDKGIEDLTAAFRADPRVRELARNPLLGTLIALVHRFEAHLPGERAKLYALCTKTLLETWPAARKRRFEEIDEGLQRVYLEDLALRMQENRRAGASGEVVIGVERLVSSLVEILLARNKEDPEVVQRRIERWVQHLDQGTGLLVEQRPGVYAFFHLSFLEYLAACALDRGEQPLINRVVELSGQPHWREVCLLVVGSKATDKKFLDLLYGRLAEKDAWQFLLGGLREEADFDDSQRASILRGVGRQMLDSDVHYWKESHLLIGQLKEYSLRHADWSRVWIVEEIQTASEEALQGIVALCSGDETYLIDQLSQRRDGAKAAADLIDFWPGTGIGRWAVDQAPFDSSVRWGRQGPAELALARSLAGNSSPSAGLTAGLLCRMVRLARTGAEIGKRSYEQLTTRKRPGGSGLPRQVVAQPGDSCIQCTPAWFANLTAHSCDEPESDRFFARSFSMGLVQRLVTSFAADFARYFSMDYTRDFTQYFATAFAADFSVNFARYLARYSNDYFYGFVLDLPSRYNSKDLPDSLQDPLKGIEGGSFDRHKGFAGRLLTRFVGEAWVGLAATVDEDKEDRLLYLQARVQNAWLLATWSTLEDSMSKGPIGATNLALYIAFGWTQATTTYEWPGSIRWKQLLSGPEPTHWLPRTQWHLCWLLHQPESLKHRAAIASAIERGRYDTQLPGVAEALVEDLGWEE